MFLGGLSVQLRRMCSRSLVHPPVRGSNSIIRFKISYDDNEALNPIGAQRHLGLNRRPTASSFLLAKGSNPSISINTTNGCIIINYDFT